MGKSYRLCACTVAMLVMALWHLPAQAAISASATISSQQLGPASYEYSMALTNTGTTPIGTYWYAWFPFYDLLPSAPTSIISPPGWTGTNAPDVFGVASARWVNTTTPLQPGQSLGGFKFDTPDSPATLAGTSFFGNPIQTSYVYIGAPQTDPGGVLIPSVVTPEPASAALLIVLPAALLMRRGKRR